MRYINLIVLVFMECLVIFSAQNTLAAEPLMIINRSDQNKFQKQYENLFQEKNYEEALRLFRTLYERGKLEESGSSNLYNSAAAELTGFQLALYKKSCAAELINILRYDPDVAARTAMAEILLLTAVGNNGYSSIRKQVPTCLTDSLAEIATELMQYDPDPFVQAIAEQAIAAKVNRENDGAKLIWPKENNNPHWFVVWNAQDPGNFLQYDYIRQAVQQGVHFSQKSLTVSAYELVVRAGHFAKDIVDRGAKKTLVEDRLNNVKNLAIKVAQAPDLTQARVEWLNTRMALRELILQSPDLDTQAFVFVKRRNHLLQHNIANNVPMANRFPPGADILRKTDLNPASPATELLGDKLGPGSIRGMDLFWDADRVVFSFTPQNFKSLATWNVFKDVAKSESNLYEMNVNGTNLHQLTFEKLQADQAPAYLPNGDIVFASSRADIGSECGPWPQQAMTMDIFKLAFQSDGLTKISRLSHNKDFDHYPHVLNNGLIGFTRWDYQERHFYYPHTIWGCRPDGTQSDLIYKSHLSDGPHSLRDAMPIPGSEDLFAIACGHHSIPEGALTQIRLAHDLNDPSGIAYVTPYVTDTEGGYGSHARSVDQGGVRDAMAMGMGGFYQTPWPLSARSLLVSAMYGAAVSCGSMIYYVDLFGNKELLARDLIYELVDPKMLKPRRKPPILPDVTKPEKTYADVYINDVYDGLEGVEKGEAKYVRIVSKVNWPFKKGEDQFGVLRWFVDQGSSPTFGFFSWSPTRVIGTVPIEEDGSAYFKAPAEMSLSFELLDKDLREIRRMRTHVEFMRGETRGCVGCHETRAYSTNVNPSRMLALKRDPSQPKPPAYEGGDRVLLDYVKHVQPVFDKNCVSCHGKDAPAAGVELTDRPDPFGFLQSYRSLFGFKYGEKIPTGGDWWYQTYFPDSYEKYSIKRDRSNPTERKKMETIYDQLISGTYPGQLVKVISRRGDAHITQPYEAGSYQSKLIMHLFADSSHVEIRKQMSSAEWEALVTFVDNNAPATGWFYAKKDQTGLPFKREVNGQYFDDLMRVDMLYPDPWDDRKPMDENGIPIWPAAPTKVQTLDDERQGTSLN